MKTVTMIIALLTLTLAASAASVTLEGRGYTYSCGYYSQKAGDFTVTYTNKALPWGSRVFLIAGWNGRDMSQGQVRPFEWADRDTREAASTAPYTWSASVSKTLAQRSSPIFFDAIDFVIQVQLPDGRTFFEKGNNSPMGFYSASFYYSDVSTCINSDNERPAMKAMAVKSVSRY